jgi:two-component system phosphate regulon response regulator PhoB
MAKVLIAEDEAALRELIRVTLDSGRFEITAVEDGVSALAAARENPPDIVFLDWHMPGREGTDVCRELRTDPRTWGAKIVMVTAQGGADARRACLDAGADEVITKPFSPLQLLDIVVAVLGPDAFA